MIVGCPNCHLRYDISHREPKDPVKCRCGASFLVPNLSQTARAWNCPSCGGATNPAKPKCEFCGVYLAFARCPDCFTLVVEGSIFCHQCGADLLKPATITDDEKTALKCPRCKTKKLKSRNIGQYHIDHCLDCGGVWLDHEVLQQVLHDKGQQKTVQAIMGSPVTADSKRDSHDVVYLKCPHCNDLMHRRNFGKTSGVIVDECIKHGIWFDKSELAAVIKFTRSRLEQVSAKQAAPPKQEQKPPSGFAQPVVVRKKHDDFWSVLGEFMESVVNLFD